MFALFFSLYNAMFLGNWTNYDIGQIRNLVSYPISLLIRWTTNIFTTSGVDIGSLTFSPIEIINLTSFVLALITSIGIVVMAVKGIKRVFGVFFMGVR